MHFLHFDRAGRKQIALDFARRACYVGGEKLPISRVLLAPKQSAAISIIIGAQTETLNFENLEK